MSQLFIQLLPVVIVIAIFFFIVRALLVATVTKLKKNGDLLPNKMSDKFLDIIRAINEVAATQQHIQSKISSIEERLVGIEKELKEIPS
jgi:hypothetical protein